MTTPILAWFDASTASDGLTVDTRRGPVDMVAVARFNRGEPIELTEAERRFAVQTSGAAPRRLAHTVRAAYLLLAADLVDIDRAA